MRIRKRLLFGPLAVVILAAALVAWLEPTRAARGWVHGEAFYDGRPTSYWRGKIDDWAKEFPSQEKAIKSMTIDPLAYSPVYFDASTVEPAFELPQPTPWDRVKGWFNSHKYSEYAILFPPEVLTVTPDTDAVLTELEGDPKYAPFVAQARKNAEILQRR